MCIFEGGNSHRRGRNSGIPVYSHFSCSASALRLRLVHCLVYLLRCRITININLTTLSSQSLGGTLAPSLVCLVGVPANEDICNSHWFRVWIQISHFKTIFLFNFHYSGDCCFSPLTLFVGSSCYLRGVFRLSLVSDCLYFSLYFKGA